MYSVMKKLISRYFYSRKAEAQAKVDVFYACNRLTDEEYADLAALIEEIYVDEPEEEYEEITGEPYTPPNEEGEV